MMYIMYTYTGCLSFCRGGSAESCSTERGSGCENNCINLVNRKYESQNGHLLANYLKNREIALK